jgi:topoisomerase IA-like protein
MPPKLPFQIGSQVEHAKFGLGAVTNINEERMSIKWDEHGEKTFVTSIAVPQLKKSDREPPAAKAKSRKRSTTAASGTRKTTRKKAAAAEAPPTE